MAPDVSICFHERSRRLGAFGRQTSPKCQLRAGPPAQGWGGTFRVSAWKQMLDAHHAEPWESWGKGCGQRRGQVEREVREGFSEEVTFPVSQV